MAQETKSNIIFQSEKDGSINKSKVYIEKKIKIKDNIIYTKAERNSVTKVMNLTWAE